MAILKTHQVRFLKEKMLSPIFGKILAVVYIGCTGYLAYLSLLNLTPHLSGQQIDLQYGVEAHFEQPTSITEKLSEFIELKLFY